MYLDRLAYLDGTLPSRFRSAVCYVISCMDALADPGTGYPWAAVHGDLSMLNMLVSQSTGHLTGVIDLAELCLLPFGFDFHAIDDLAGQWSHKAGQSTPMRRR